ncbi:MAG TPA: ATP-binding protein [Lacipirellulaceae bacterium]|nr:ATP-binding protein [Lacipirellulaceae bacterium]
MFQSRLFWKLFFTAAGVNLIGAAVVGLLISHSIGDSVDGASELRRWLWVSTAVECVCVCGLSYWIIGRVIRPVTTLNEAADALADGNFGQRVYVPSHDELGRLAGTLNRMSQAMLIRTTQLGQTVARQSTVLGGMVEGVVAVDARERIVLANDAAGRLFDFRPNSAEGRPLLEVIRNHALRQAVTTVLSTGEPQRFEASRAGPPTMFVDIHVQPLPGDPCPGVVLVIHDTTTVRRLESMRREFVANVSHELKTPLSSIKAYTETLRNGAIEDPQTSQRFLERIEEQAERLHRLILDMLMLARIESDHQAFEIVALDVSNVVDSCLETHRNAAETKRITVLAEAERECGGAESSRVRADREGLREILDNLLDNAIKYTPEGGSVRISWTASDKNKRPETLANGQDFAAKHSAFNSEYPTSSRQMDFVRISVHDSGIGIKPEDQERIFERFYRVDKARSRELGGTGLGLSIVKHLAQSMNGTVTVASEVGKGSIFTVELPAA